MSEVYEEIVDATALVMELHNKGCKDLNHLYSTSQYKPINEEDLSLIVVDVATEIASYNFGYRVHPTKQDTTKILTFSAAALAKRDENYSAVPLFYAYIDFLDNTYLGTGMTLRDFGESIFFAENLNRMLKSGQWIAPFCYFRAIDLCFEKCAIPRVEALMGECETLNSVTPAIFNTPQSL